MATRIAINGFGRIGRCVVRALHKRNIGDVELVAINDLTDPKTLAHLLKYDSIHRTFEADVSATDGGIRVGDKEVRVTALKDPRELPWKELKVDVVLECTGLFTSKDKASGHLSAGASKVIISAPATDHDKTIVMGVNQGDYDWRQAPHPLERLVHHELSGAGGQGAARQLRHRARLDDDRARLHQRSELLDLPHRKAICGVRAPRP
jgi:glyceraldehyde-3-phosphate dehydrogenase type I